MESPAAAPAAPAVAPSDGKKDEKAPQAKPPADAVPEWRLEHGSVLTLSAAGGNGSDRLFTVQRVRVAKLDTTAAFAFSRLYQFVCTGEWLELSDDGQQIADEQEIEEQITLFVTDVVTPFIRKQHELHTSGDASAMPVRDETKAFLTDKNKYAFLLDVIISSIWEQYGGDVKLPAFAFMELASGALGARVELFEVNKEKRLRPVRVYGDDKSDKVVHLLDYAKPYGYDILVRSRRRLNCFPLLSFCFARFPLKRRCSALLRPRSPRRTSSQLRIPLPRATGGSTPRSSLSRGTNSMAPSWTPRTTISGSASVLASTWVASSSR